MKHIMRRPMLVSAASAAAALLVRRVHAEELGHLVPTDPPIPAPDISFASADGTEHHLSEFRGHGMVINLWATWCAPCAAEMPSLAKLSKTLAPDDIAVLPLSSDRGGANAVEAFYQQHHITGLPVLLDPKSAAAHAWHARGIPTSLIIDKQGRERARLEGSTDWSKPEIAETVRKLVNG